jgi:hypothetical protein
MLALTNEQRQTAGSLLNAYATDPTADAAKWKDTVEKIRQISDDPGYQRAADGLLMHQPQIGGMSDAQASQTLQQYARNAARATGVDVTAGAPTAQPYFDKQGNLSFYQSNAQAPGGVKPMGGAQPIGVGLGPTQTPEYQAKVQAATTAAGGAAGTDVARANQVSTAIQPSQAMIPITKEIDSLADQIHSGKFAASISQAAAAVGLKEDTYARQLLVKDLGQVRGAATRNAPSDEMANTILSGYPEATSDPQTIHTSMDLVRGQFRQNMERGQLLIQHRSQRPDLQGFAQADDRFTSTNTPYMSEFRSLSPEARTAFYGRHFKTPQEAQAFKNAALGQQ